jgi:nicotinate-nucleotide--dimethylbenzimidazole phosphoribosyltransferase
LEREGNKFLNRDMMRDFNIVKPDGGIREALIDKINNLTKPKGSLGVLEELALQVGLVQQTLSPALKSPNHVVFAGDHGVTEEGVSLSPKEVTWQQVGNFLKGHAGINFLCRQHGFKLTVVDSGVDFDFPAGCGVVEMKVGRGTRNFLHGPAMTPNEMDLCIERGADVVDKIHATGCNVICFGEMGIGNTSPSSIWMSYFGNIPLTECIGAGSGVEGKGLRHKIEILLRSAENYERTEGTFFSKLYGGSSDCGKGYLSGGNIDYVKEVIRWFGGYEMVMTIGAMLRAAELKMLVLVDGFIMTNCMLAALQINPLVKEYAIFGHCGDETGHRKVLDLLGARPLLSLGFRLGEGTGAICAYPIVDSAVRMINEMASFSDAAITKYF